VRGIVDRIEEKIAVIQLKEGGEMLIPIGQLPPGSKEGSVVDIAIRLDEKVAGERRRAIRERQQRLR